MIAEPATIVDWIEWNRLELVRHVERIHQLLERFLDTAEDGEPVPVDDPSASSELPVGGGAAALDELTSRFGLSPFERDVVLLCAATELDSHISSLISRALDDPVQRWPTFGLALACLPGGHWSALMPAGPLRGWRLIAPIDDDLTTTALRLDERVLHYLLGINQMDARLRSVVTPIVPEPLTTSYQEAADRAADSLAASRGAGLVQVAGGLADDRMSIAAAAAAHFGASAFALRDLDLPAEPQERFELACLCAREWRLGGFLLVLDVGASTNDERIAAFADSIGSPIAVTVQEPIPALADRGLTIAVPIRTPDERLAQWTAVIGPAATSLNGALTQAIAQFDLNPRAIRLAAERAFEPGPEDSLDGWARGSDGSRSHREATKSGQRLWDACRMATRPRMEGLAARIEAVASWDDLVLPHQQLAALRLIAAQARNRHRVYVDWGFAARSSRGLGISSLFVGESGTGKTMAAEVLAGELRLDLYRIDLASVVSKYIGETEKNLGRIFDSAEGSGAILLFDEADALFGRRSEVRDSHDRYANIEVSYLLQRMEAYRGLTILTTNQGHALDQAFLRRIRFIVRFPYPDASHRAAIWRGIFPPATPLESLDFDDLGQLNVAGGHIRNIAMAAAFLAAERGAAITMAILAEAAQTEYSKLERSLSDSETRGWA